ncbi:hypothetical protein KIM372_04300 [Bombiscardovia nodaiensis]|uniref:Uncharacterized protein n=1 Tax=Bombiscardovia nodaiensis TaxID=2932181 RepID=A0ABN6SAS3_9BIFI|nr:hypothetical protein KIM372_04300 [Bombiscardovia nodaiensis]
MTMTDHESQETAQGAGEGPESSQMMDNVQQTASIEEAATQVLPAHEGEFGGQEEPVELGDESEQTVDYGNKSAAMQAPSTPQDAPTAQADSAEVEQAADGAESADAAGAGAAEPTDPTQAIPEGAQGESGENADSWSQGASGPAFGGQPTWQSGPSGAPPTYISTPPSEYMRPPATPQVRRPTGPNAPTIVFGLLIGLVGLACLAAGLFFSWYDGVGVSFNVGLIMTVLCGGLGGFLLLAGLVWGLVSWIKGRDDDERHAEFRG